jgi:hypothetical protein
MLAFAARTSSRLELDDCADLRATMTLAFSIAAVAAIAAVGAAARTLRSFARERSRAAELERRLDLVSELLPSACFTPTHTVAARTQTSCRSD